MSVVIALVILSGVALASSFPPFDASFVAWFALVPFFAAFHLVAGGRGAKKKAFFAGYIFGFVFFLCTIYWVVNSIHNFGGVPIAPSIGVMLLLSLYLAIYPALFALIITICRPLHPVWSFFLYPALWVSLEYIREIFFLGFPWVFAGYSQAGSLELIQIADIFGVYGVSFLVVAVNGGIYLALKAAGGLRGSWLRDGGLPVLLSIILLAGALAYGLARIPAVDNEVKAQESVKAGVAQGNIEQSMKWARSKQLDTVETYVGLTEKMAGDGASLIVWPETASPFFLAYDNIFGSMVREAARSTGSHIITGAPHYEYPGSTPEVDQYNSAFLISPNDGIIGRYDKVKLVPFGEYVPLKSVLFFIDKITEGVGDFSSGLGSFPLVITDRDGADIKAGMLICFESIFPGLAARSVVNGANLLVTITNDAWFGESSAPYQHFQMSIFRAVENRSFLLRSANTGISGAIDPVGRVLKKTALFREAAFTESVGLRRGGPTFFARYVWLVPVVTIVFSIISLLCGISRRGQD